MAAAARHDSVADAGWLLEAVCCREDPWRARRSVISDVERLICVVWNSDLACLWLHAPLDMKCTIVNFAYVAPGQRTPMPIPRGSNLFPQDRP